MAVAVALSGGGAFEIVGARISIRRLYTPVLLLTVLVAARVWVALRPRVTVRPDVLLRLSGAAVVAATTCLVLMAPLLAAMATHLGEERWIAPPVWWRSSAPGVDALALAVPNPLGTLTGWMAAGWLARMPGGLHENVASVPWVAIGTVAAAAILAKVRFPRYWVVFTVASAVMALGPFLHVAGWNTYVPGPWAALRYLPIVGAARMPTRLAVLVMLGAGVLLACAVRHCGPGARGHGCLAC